ncbi:ATP-binding protein [Saccharicrinis sp. FJH54]|uniref:ATP-binding protein n=1 Tax=Saccharicrinis sp. FJH54 TaxID=3344665 RepID=UPI0035D4FB6B
MKVPLDDVILEKLLTRNSHNEEYEHIAHIFNLIPSLLIILSPDGEIAYINEAGCKLLGSDNKNLVGKKFTKFIARGDHKSFNDLLKTLDNSGVVPDSLILKVFNSNEDIVSLSCNTSIIESENHNYGLLIAATDVSHMMRHYQMLERDKNLYEKLAAQIPDINLFVLDTDLKFIISVGNELNLSDAPDSDLNGKTINQLEDKNLIEIWKPHFDSAMHGKEIATSYNYNKRYYDIWVFPLYDENNEIMGVTAITQNVTDQKELELKLRKTIDEAENANKIKSEFLANISHEIRTPLNAIIGFSEQLSQTALQEQQEEFVKVISKSSEHLLYLVNDILILSKIEANAIKFDVSPFKIESVITYIYNTLKIKAEQKNLIFTYDIDPRLNMVIKGDPFRLRQIIINLVNNAIKFTHNGYVEMKCFMISDEEDEVKIRFDVMDTGIGISADKMATIFDQFRQADSRITKRYGGTGLGLTICKNLIEKQNGSLTVKSEEGMGTRFSFVLPFRKGSETELSEENIDDFDFMELSDKHILLVDDDSVNRLLGKTILEKLKCNYELAGNGEEAIKILKETQFDAVLLDIHMPDISGLDVAKYVRRELKNDTIKLIAVTADVFNEDIKNYYSAGIDDYLIKPYRELELYNVLRKVLKIKPDKNSKSAEKVIVKASENDLYNLRQLKDIAEGNSDFIANMLRTFIVNSENAIIEFRKSLEHNKWNSIKETAHRILPSYRHLEAYTTIDLLTDIKNMSSNQFGKDKAINLIEKVTTNIRDIIDKLNREIKDLNA